jgi:hypothetical protein
LNPKEIHAMTAENRSIIADRESPKFDANPRKHLISTGTIEFKCIRINLKKSSTFEPDQSQIDSLIEFDLTIDDDRLSGLKAEVRQQNGTDYQTQPLEVGGLIAYNGPWNDEEFREHCVKYYRDVVGSSGIGAMIGKGERELVERVAIQFYRREVITLPSFTEREIH